MAIEIKPLNNGKCDFFWVHNTHLSFLSNNYCSLTKSSLTLCDSMGYSKPVFPVLHYFLEVVPTHVHRVSDANQPSYLLLSPSPQPSIFPSIRIFSNESVLHIMCPKYWSFSPSREYSGLISFRIDWFDLLAVQGILKSLYNF